MRTFMQSYRRCVGFHLIFALVAVADTAAQPTKNVDDLKRSAQALKDEQYRVASALLKQYPNDFDALRVMGFAHSSHGNLDEMFRCWEKCRQLRPNRADIYDQLGRYSNQIEEYDDAISYWQQAVQIDAKYPGVHQRIGNAYLSLGKLKEAEGALERELSIFPRDDQTRYLLGEVQFQLERFEASKQNYLKAVAVNPKHANSYYGLVKVCARLGQTDDLAKYSKRFQELEDAASRADKEFRRSFDDLQEMRNRLAVTCVDAGRVHIAQGNTRMANQLWRRAAEVNAKNVVSRSLLVSLYSKTKETQNAVRYLKELTVLQPKNVSNFQKLGFLQARLQNFAAAETSFKSALQLAPERGSGYRDLAKFYLNTKRRPADAKRLAERALQLEPVADSHFVLGWANAVTGNRAAAIRSLNKAMEMAPENDMYRRLYDAVQNAKPKKK